jgi:O-antigen/teichoic acid export membrane protein
MPAAASQVTRQRAARDVVMQIVARVLNLALGVVVTALVTRTLGAAYYGQLTTLVVVFGMVGYLTDFGVEAAVTREASREPEREQQWLGALVLQRMIVLVPILLASLVAVFVLQRGEQMLVAGLILVAALPFSTVGVLGIVYQLRVNNLVPMLVLTLKSILLAVAIGLIYWLGGGLIAWTLALSLTNVIGALATTVPALRITGGWPPLPRELLAPLIRVAIPLGVGSVLIVLYAQIDQLIVFEIAGSHSAGLYGAVYNVLNQAHFIPISLLTTLTPIIAASWPGQRERMLKAVRLSAEFLVVSSLGALVFTIVAATPLVQLFFGSSFTAAAPALPVLAGAFVFICFGYLNGTLLLVLGIQRHFLPIGLAGLVFNVVGNLILVPAYGFMGAAWMTLLTEILVFVSSLVLILRTLGLRRPGIGRMGRTFVAAVLLAGALSALKLVNGSLWVLTIAACLCYPALLFALRALALDDVRILLKRRALA